ncbi:hypothetical protein CYLTODRAFT_488749 [Cylindrobasidium torrendii FP15055 ss-10]|uniref:Timeless N-terminal domain-containing protein n=1 Tax=Cylindrobasidium torrendii FP15055 ss-10 TaxID=1314674 RepID=A0A0D7BHP0_9AGAR|nr:hypothetical protein CYLTODRAFT_488749 [Cylindrobasidium torrendii FP15055 ss-10]
MAEDEVIIISDGEGDGNGEPETTTYDFFSPLVKRVVSALGGGTPYRPGDSAYACLKDLKRLWRQDDDVVARLLWKSRAMTTDLIPLLLVLPPDDKRAVATVDLITAMTWPVDIAAELKELDENEEDVDARPEYTHIIAAHAAYKKALCGPGVLEAILNVLLPPFAKTVRARTPRDGQIINLVLHLYRNMAFVKSDSSAYMMRLRETSASDLLLTIAANNSRDALFQSYNTIVMETFYLLTRFVSPIPPTAAASRANLASLLEEDAKLKKRPLASRHSRFGTTVQVTMKNSSDKDKFILRRPGAVDPKTSAIELWDAAKKPRAKPAREVVFEERLTPPADAALRELMNGFIDGVFNDFLADMIKDIRAERPKITEADNLRLLCLSSWVLEFFLTRGEKEVGLVAEITERAFIGWVLRRVRDALDDKPKRLSEVRAGVAVLTQLILVIELLDGKETFLSQLVYNGETLDIAVETLKLAIDGSVRMVYELLRVLEGTEKMIRKKKGGEGEAPWSFDAFEFKFATPAITTALLDHLATNPTPLKYVIGLMHRQVVKLKAEGLYFNVSTLLLFQRLLKEQAKEKDLVKFITFVLRQFFKAMEEYPFLAVEAFFPRTGGDWKKFSTYQPPKKEKKGRKTKEVVEKELHVKDGYDYKDKVGIAMKALSRKDDAHWEEWVKRLLLDAVSQRKREMAAPEDDDDEDAAENADKPKPELTDYKVAYVDDDSDIPYRHTGDEKASAASKNPNLKLLLRLCGFRSDEGIDDELEWTFPKTLDPEEKLHIVEDFLLVPTHLDPDDALTTQTTRRRKRLPVEEPSSSSSSDASAAEITEDEDEAAFSGDEGERSEKKRRKMKKREEKKRRKEEKKANKRKRRANTGARQQKKEAEEAKYKSKEFIEDSDADYEDMESFLQKEAEKRKNRKAPVRMYEERPEGMRAHGMKKRKTRGEPEEKGARRKKRKNIEYSEVPDEPGDWPAQADSDAEEDMPEPAPKPRPKPRQAKATSPAESLSPQHPAVDLDIPSDDASIVEDAPPTRLKPRLARVHSDAVVDIDDNDEDNAPVPGRKARRMVFAEDDDE